MLNSSRHLSLKLMQRCPSCQTGVRAGDINVIQETNGSILAHLGCSQCLANFLAYIISSANGMIGNAIHTDLTYEETLKFINLAEISDNDVLNLYKLTSQDELIDLIKVENNNYRKDK